jgi:WD40 repeat protein
VGGQALLSVGLVMALAGLRAPDRLTAGAGDQFLGALSPDEAQLYFVSDQESTTQIYVQDVARGLPLLLFDEMADVSLPRPSPDGRHLLYISYQRDAAGDLCVRDLPKGGNRRCLTDEKSAEAQAVWMPDGSGIAVVTRSGLHGDFALVRIGLDGRRGDVLVNTNVANPAISPDGHFVAYVPIERGAAEVGPSFLSRSSGALAVARLGGGGGAPARVAFDLPGASAFPAFSLDGKWLYFTQFLNDTNLDGAIDGKDNGVLFRASFDDGKVGAPVQLTSARWSCQYELPGKTRLVTTCQRDGSLDVYALPLDGGVPPDWTPARIDDELSAARDRWDMLLLLARRVDSPAVLPRMVQLHLELGEYESAAFYAKRLAAHDGAVGGILGELTAHRKAERALGRGMLSAAFVKDARARLERLAGQKHPLAAVARSEIYDTLGEEDRARRELDGIDVKDPLVADLYAERLLALYRDDPRYFDLYRPLAEQSLEHAQAWVRELLRGADANTRRQRTDAWLKKVDPDSEVAYLLMLERALADLTPDSQEQVRGQVFDLYRKNKEFARRQALVAGTVRRALSEDNEYLLYQFADTWVSYVPREKAERRRAERLYRDAVLERAYVEERRGVFQDARGHYYGVTLQTDALEAHAGFLEMRLREKIDPLKDYKQEDDALRYARAYLGARGLPAEKDAKKHEATAQRAIAELEKITQHAPQRPEVHLLWGYIDEQRFLRGAGRLAAVEANAHLMLALDLARESPRTRAAALDALGRVQSGVGNFAIALGWLEQRVKLPFADEKSRLSTCLALARARFHAGTGAATTADECVAQTKDDLARFRPLALDRSALYHLTAGDYAVAVDRYAELAPLVSGGNKLSTEVGWAAASLGAGKLDDARAHVDAAAKLPGADPLVLDGLRAQTEYAAGRFDAAAAAMTRRRDGVAKLLKKTDLDEYRLELANAEAQLALYAYRRKAPADALPHLEAALKHWDGWSKNTNTPIEDTGLAILTAYAQLHVDGGVPLDRLRLDLPQRLRATYDVLSTLRNPLWETARRRFELYLSLLNLRRS